MPAVRLEINARRVRGALLIIIGALTVASLLAQVSRYVLEFRDVGGLVPLFDAGGEANIPTYFSALALLACAVLFAVIAATERGASPLKARRWAGLALLAGVASVDEAAALHETIGGLVQRAFAPGGYLHFVWVIPGALVVVAVAIAYRPFVARLPTDLRRALMAGAGLWAGSALFIELVEGRILASQQGFPTFASATVGTLQETGEMLGVLVMLDGLLGHVAARGVALVAAVRCDQARRAPSPVRRTGS